MRLLHDRDHRHPRPRNPRFARQSHDRGRCDAGRRLLWPRRRALGRLDGNPRSRGEARRRSRALPGQGRSRRGRERQWRDRRHAAGLRGRGAGGGRRGDDRTRRHAQQVAARRQRHSRRVARRRQGRRRRGRPAALSLHRRHAGAHSADADDEHHQWRRPCRQSHRLPGIHDHAGRRRKRRRRDPLGRGDFPHAEERAEEGRIQHGGGRRRRLRAESAFRRSRARLHHEGHRDGGLQAGRRRVPRHRRRRVGVLQGRQICLHRRESDPLGRASRSTISPSWPRLTPSSRSRTAWPRTIGRAGSC